MARRGISKADFLSMIQQRAARVAMTASATRGQGAGGVVAVAREFMGDLRLGDFGTSDQKVYLYQLDAATDRLRARLPKRAASWGLSRKLLNIFLRDCLYTTYLAQKFRLRRAEYCMEIPLDSITSKRIHREDNSLARWPGVKRLEPALSAAYQGAAMKLARQHGLARVHLDAYWWGARA